MWEWSHTQEAYAFAEEQLRNLPRRELLALVSEWNYHFRENSKRKLCLKFARKLPDDILADWIWEQASSWEHGRTCSNGGHELYLDPQGYRTVDLGLMPENWQPAEY